MDITRDFDQKQVWRARGITWLPKGTPFADHLALVAVDGAGHSRIEIMTRDGNLVHEIVLASPFDSNYVGSVDVFDPDHLVVALLPNEIYVIDYAGVPVNGPVKVFEGVACEGVVRTPGGVAVADYYSGRIFALDTALERWPENDLHNAFGVKLNPDGIAWNSHKHRYIVTSIVADIDWISRPGFTLPISLDDPVPSFHPGAHGLVRARHVTYMPDEHKILLAHTRNPTALLIYDETGRLLEQIDVSSLATSIDGTHPLTSAVYVPVNQEFYLRFAGDTERLRVVSRTGAFKGDVDLRATGATGFSLMTLEGNNLVIRTNEGLIRTDLNGALLATYDTAPLRTPRLAGLTAITTGPNAGKFAVCDSSGTEVVVFTLP